MTHFYNQVTLPDFKIRTRATPSPTKIGPYKIERLMYKGSTTDLYLGSHVASSQPIALKVLRPQLLKNREVIARFLKEAKIIAMTQHPNIIRLYGQGEWEKGVYIAMEYIRGISLTPFIRQNSLVHRRILEILLQISYALSHLHMHGITHRDLKPDNILMDEKGDIKVIDFSISQFKEDISRFMTGTPDYMSPEQKENLHPITPTSDIYSLGVIAYELFLGRFSKGIIHLGYLPLPLQKLLARALKTKPEERYPDILDWIGELTEYMQVQCASA